MERKIESEWKEGETRKWESLSAKRKEKWVEWQEAKRSNDPEITFSHFHFFFLYHFSYSFFYPFTSTIIMKHIG